MRTDELVRLYEERLGERPGATRWNALALALSDMVEMGLLAAGDRLPTHRELSRLLGVTVGTVSRAYAETARRGVTAGSVGRGTYVASREREVDIYAQTLPPRSSARRVAEGSPLFSVDHPLDMGFITPFEHLNPSLEKGVRVLADRGDINGLGGYQAPAGLLRHREAGALWAARYGLATRPDNILVCAGAQHALLTVLASLFGPGDRVAAEQLSYPLLRQLAKRLSLHLTPIRVDKNGMLPDALEAACRTKQVKGVYLMPMCHNPTLTMIPESRRRELVEICRRYDVTIIEDDPYSLSLEQRLQPISRMAPERSCFIASTSEALGAGLRVAYLSAPDSRLEALEHTIAYTVSMAPPLMAELASLWVADGTADTVLAEKRRAATRANTMAREILDGFSLETRPTGFFCWLKLPATLGAAGDFAARARERGIIVADSSYFSVDGSPSEPAVRLALGLRDQGLLEGSLRTLAEILQQG